MNLPCLISDAEYKYATKQSAGMDLPAFIDAPIRLNPMGRVLIPTGLSIQLPPGYEAQVRPRSGLALEYGITVLNSPGTIDADYRGEIKVLLINLGSKPYRILPNDKIAQLVVAQYTQVQLDPTMFLDTTERSDGGFGHTGK